MMNKLAQDIALAVNYKLAGLGGALVGGGVGAIGSGLAGGLYGGMLGGGIGTLRGLIQKHQAMKNRNFLQKLLNMDAGPQVWDVIKHDAGTGAKILGGLGAVSGGLNGMAVGSLSQDLYNDSRPAIQALSRELANGMR